MTTLKLSKNSFFFKISFRTFNQKSSFSIIFSIKKVPFLSFFQSKKFLFKSKKFLFVSADYHKINVWICRHTQYICIILYILATSIFFAQFFSIFRLFLLCFLFHFIHQKTNKVNQKSRFLNFYFITRSFGACISIGANLLPGVFSLRSKKPICICSLRSHDLHIIAHFVRSMQVSHI